MPALAIVPAAGSAERFGSAKLLADIGGVPLLERTVRSLLDGGVERAVVVLGPGEKEVRDKVPALGETRVQVALNRDPSRGMISSIQAGLRESNGDPIVVLPGDMPYVTAATVALLLDAHRSREAIISPRFDGKRGHPVVIPGRLRDEILEADTRATLHEVLKRHASERVDIDVYDRGVLRDVDTPEDLEHVP